ncbi:hypothetical protein N787_00100 [Arenimonas metalli CF5-1]|uniref:Uncharacterized protein n=2 Tax=Arenimonas TaxID=490567 RepID=A0A091BA54_9GAMM|nr:hypothetical protein N787_00100 [Arenimonas metalli CF5-1]
MLVHPQAVPHVGPEPVISSKARQRLPKGGHGDAPSQTHGMPLLHRRGVRGH